MTKQIDNGLRLMTQALRDGKWRTSRAIKQETDLDSRTQRAIAEASLRFISLPSKDKGYKLISKAKKSEIKRAYAVMQQRADGLVRRVQHLAGYL